MSSKPVGGFSLVLGALYNDGWFNDATPTHNAANCPKCGGPITLHSLHKFIFAFGNVIEKFTRVATCPDCLHEKQLDSPKTEKRQKATKRNLGAIFAKLPQSVQAAILSSGGIK